MIRDFAVSKHHRIVHFGGAKIGEHAGFKEERLFRLAKFVGRFDLQMSQSLEIGTKMRFESVAPFHHKVEADENGIFIVVIIDETIDIIGKEVGELLFVKLSGL